MNKSCVATATVVDNKVKLFLLYDSAMQSYTLEKDQVEILMKQLQVSYDHLYLAEERKKQVLARSTPTPGGYI